MAIAGDGRWAGFVSGLRVEAAIVMRRGCLRDSKIVMLGHGAGIPVLDLQPSCGGRIHILVRQVPNAGRYVDALRVARAARRFAGY